jgi:signal transduction histidine kinase
VTIYYLFPINALLITAMGLYAIYKKNNIENGLFLTTNLSIASWNLCIWYLETRATAANVNLVSDLQLISALLFSVNFYFFCRQLASKSSSPASILGHTVIAILVVLILLCTDLITYASLQQGKVVFDDDIGYLLYAIYLVAYTLLGISALVKLYAKKPESRQHIIHLLVGIGLFFLITIWCDVILPLWGNYDYLLYGYLSFMFPSTMFFITTFLKYDLAGTRLAVSKHLSVLVTYGMVIFSSLLVYQLSVTNTAMGAILLPLLCLFWSLYAAPFKRFLMSSVRRTFVSGWYDANEVISKISEQLTVEKDIHRIIWEVGNLLDSVFEVEILQAFIADKEQGGRSYNLQSSAMIAETYLPTKQPGADIISEVTSLNQPTMIFSCSAQLQDFCKQLGHHRIQRTLVLPLHSPELLEGFIILGERSNQDPYSEYDMQFFKRLLHYLSAVFFRLTPLEKLETIYLETKHRLYQTEIQLMRTEKIEAVAHATRQCHHELKTPLSIIKLAVGRLQNLHNLDEFKTLVYQEIERASTVINETLTITDSAKPQPSEKKLVDVNEAINRCFKLIPVSGYTLHTELSDIPKIYGVLSDLEIVFTNLMTNAKEAMPNGGQLKICSFQKNSDIVITFADSGIGIPEELKRRIWDPYSSGHQTKVGNSTAGRGWGMTIVHRIITEQGGNISFRSHPNEGTEFTIRLPIPKHLEVQEDQSHLIFSP